MNVLIGSADILHVKMTRFLLEDASYKVTHCMSASSVLKTLKNDQVDLILLDSDYSDTSSVDLCLQIRSEHKLPLIFVASDDAVHERVAGLRAGADDYVGKPYNPQELLARIEAVMRRYREDLFSTYLPLSVGPLHLDPYNRQVRVRDDGEKYLTAREFQLLYYLVQNARCVLSSQQLLQKIWGDNYGIESNLVPVYIGRLRRKIETDPLQPRHIVRVRDLGYCFKP